MKTCRCHGLPMRWTKDPHQAAGGHWLCTVKRAASRERYDSTAKRAASRATYEAQPHRKLGKQLHEMTRVRVRY